MNELAELKGKHLFIQPHLDDVPFSVGSLILNDYFPKQDCSFFTIFGKEFFNIRSYEHNNVTMDILKVQEENWFKNAGIRNNRYELEEAGYRGITDVRKLFRTKLASEFTMDYESLGYGNKGDVWACIKEILKKNESDYVWIPAGIGGHCDHLAVRQAMIELADDYNGKGILFYEELPYRLYSRPLDWNKCMIRGFHKEKQILHELSLEEEILKYESLKYFDSQIDDRQAKILCSKGECICLWVRE